MIQVENLTRRFGRLTAIDNITFAVARGEIVGFLGPNGAGKTTTMRILSCFLPPTCGTARVAGLDVMDESLAIRQKIGYVPENPPLYLSMRVVEYLRFRGCLKGVRGRRLRQRMNEVMECCGLTDVRRRIMGSLSRGYRQRIGLADALIHEPELLILDEPTTGLDPNQKRQFREMLKSLAPRYTVLLSSHILGEVESLCHRVLIINGGRIAASDTTENLVGLMRGNPRVIVEVKGPQDVVRARLEGIPGVLKVASKPLGDWVRFSCECEKGTDVRPDVFRAMAAPDWVLRELKEEKVNLEDVFFAMTADGGGAG